MALRATIEVKKSEEVYSTLGRTDEDAMKWVHEMLWTLHDRGDMTGGVLITVSEA
jgi:hypothetical protein